MYELFGYITLLTGQGLAKLYPPFQHCQLHPPYCIPLPTHLMDPEDRQEEEEEDSQGLGTEFYPVDPLSRGMIDRLYVLNRLVLR